MFLSLRFSVRASTLLEVACGNRRSTCELACIWRMSGADGAKGFLFPCVYRSGVNLLRRRHLVLLALKLTFRTRSPGFALKPFPVPLTPWIRCWSLPSAF